MSASAETLAKVAKLIGAITVTEMEESEVMTDQWDVRYEVDRWRGMTDDQLFCTIIESLAFKGACVGMEHYEGEWSVWAFGKSASAANRLDALLAVIDALPENVL